MTKLADAIRRSQRIDSAPMGFGAARPAPKPTMVVAALVKASDSLAGLQDAGAEVVMIDARGGSIAEDAAKKAVADAGNAAVGVIGNVDLAQAASLKSAGVDFIVFEAESSPAALLLDEDLGYVLSLNGDQDETFLRSLDSLNLDGIFLEKLPSPLTVARQLELNRIGLLARKPLLCLVEAGTSTEELRCLRSAGSAVVAVAGGADAVKQLKETVASLPPRRQRRDERTVVSLPRGQVPSEDEDDD